MNILAAILASDLESAIAEIALK